MDFSELPTELFVLGKRKPDQSVELSLHREKYGALFLGAWDNLADVSDWLRAWSRENSVLTLTSRELFLLVMTQPVEFLLHNPIVADGDFTREGTIVLPGDRVVRLWKRRDVWCVVRDLLEEYGIDQQNIAAVREYWIVNSHLKPLELVQNITQVLSSIRQQEEDERSGAETSLPLSDEASHHVRALREFHELWGAASAPPEGLEEAMRDFPPRDPCSRCGEATSVFVSLSPNKTAATWKCCYCGKQVIVRGGDPKAARRREPIPRLVQREVWQRDGGRCVACGSSEKLEFDHIIAIANGGSNTVRNIQLLCERCNRSKGKRIPGEF